jgi:hypothetical protein
MVGGFLGAAGPGTGARYHHLAVGTSIELGSVDGESTSIPE